MVITLVQGNTAFHFLCARRYETCPRVVVEIGAIICVKRNMNPSELFESDLSSPVQKTRLQVVLTIHTSIPNVAKYLLFPEKRTRGVGIVLSREFEPGKDVSIT